jgi:zinc transport system substrate-binding protein
MNKHTVRNFSLILALAASCLTGCSTANASVNPELTTDTQAADPSKLHIVCTIFPEYDWVKQILGEQADHAEVTYLLNNGTDLHSYQPTADDMIRISTCDLFIYVGGESDKWAVDALKESVNKDMRTISLMDAVGSSAKEEELKEGMQGEEEEDEAEEDGEIEYDEHVWLSLKNAGTICKVIADDLSAIDPDHADSYQTNLDSYTAKLDQMDNDFQTLADTASVKTLVFADRFPFRYFVDDYGLDYYAAFIGCSAETEASFETVAFLSDKLNELGCDTVFTLENSDHSIAETIIRTAGRDAAIAELNSLQSVSAQDIADGASYLSLMQKNYDVLAKAIQ